MCAFMHPAIRATRDGKMVMAGDETVAQLLQHDGTMYQRPNLETCVVQLAGVVSYRPVSL